MKGFQFSIPVKIYFGIGKLGIIGQISKAFGPKVMLILGSVSMEKEKVAAQVIALLESEGLKVEKFGGIETNPRIEKIMEGAEIAKKFKPTAIIGLGGGSVIDTAKAISLAVTHDGDLWEYRISGKLGMERIENKLIPIITIPTAFGTGSEVTPATVISQYKSKEVIVSPYMFPKVAVIDPSLSVSLSPELTSKIGIDAFVQGMEAFVSTNANAMSDLFALEATKLAFTYLPKCVSDGRDLESRSMIALSALYGGLSIILAGVGAVHALAAPLSARYNIHHGHAVSILLLEVMKYNLDACAPRFARLAEALGVDIKGMKENEAADEAIARTRLLLEELKLYPHQKLRELGVKKQDLEILAKGSFNPDMETNPKKMSTREIVSIFRNVL